MYASYGQLGAQPEPNRDLYQVEELNDPQQRQNILANNTVVCIDVYAHWCGPCKQTEPAYSLLAQQYSEPGRCAVVKENYEKKFTQGVNALPTYVFFVNGVRQPDEVVGADLNQVEKKLQMYKQKASRGSQQYPSMTQGSMPPNGIQQQYPSMAMSQQHNDHNIPPPPPGFQTVAPGEMTGPPAGRAGVRSFRPNQAQVQYFEHGAGQPYQNQPNYHQMN